MSSYITVGGFTRGLSYQANAPKANDRDHGCAFLFICISLVVRPSGATKFSPLWPIEEGTDGGAPLLI